MMTSEQSILLNHDHLLNTYPGNSVNSQQQSSASSQPIDLHDDPQNINPFPSLTSEDGHNDFETSLTASNPQAVLFALERAVDLLRGQVEQERQRDIQRRRKPLIPMWLTNHLLLITFLIQVVGVGVLEIFYAVKKSGNTTDVQVDNIIVITGDSILCLIEAIHLIVVFLVSFKLAKQVLHHTASGTFLAQCYLSTVLLFAGLYTLEFRFDDSSWEHVNATDSIHPTLVYLRMLYFSVSTATLCGTSTVEPLKWFTFLTVGIQMLLSFVYFASILSLTIVPRKYSKVGLPPREKSLTRFIRQCCSICFPRRYR